jgi:chromosome segregation ATPase
MNISLAHEASSEAAYRDTVALLEDEIARLEAELRLRDLVTAEATETETHPGTESNQAFEARITELTAELARREEESALLWDEIRTFEEAAAAKQAEWEQLHRWITEVEQRVEVRVDQDGELTRDLDAQRRAAEDAAVRLESERRGWETQRRAFQEELESLRSRLAVQTGIENTESAITSLQEENERLRDNCRELANAAARASEVDDLRAELRMTRDALAQARRELQTAIDEQEHERQEHAAELASLRIEIAREVSRTRDNSGDERMTAFRQHLRELQDREDEERRSKQLSTRIARLWRRTGPKR